MLSLDTCQNSGLYVCPFGCEHETDRQTHMHTTCQNYYTRQVRDVGCKKLGKTGMVSKSVKH